MPSINVHCSSSCNRTHNTYPPLSHLVALSHAQEEKGQVKFHLAEAEALVQELLLKLQAEERSAAALSAALLTAASASLPSPEVISDVISAGHCCHPAGDLHQHHA